MTTNERIALALEGIENSLIKIEELQRIALRSLRRTLLEARRADGLERQSTVWLRKRVLPRVDKDDSRRRRREHRDSGFAVPRRIRATT